MLGTEGGDSAGGMVRLVWGIKWADMDVADDQSLQPKSAMEDLHVRYHSN